MAIATDKNYIVQQFYLGKAAPGSTLVSPITPDWHYEPTADRFAYNLTRANELLDQAGYNAWWTDGSGNRYRMASHNITIADVCSTCVNNAPRTVTIPIGTHLTFRMVTRQEAPDENQIALYLQQNWRLIGVNIVSPITVEEEIAMSTDVYGGEFETYIWWWSGDVDPNYLLSIQSNYTLDGWSDNYFDNATYNDPHHYSTGFKYVLVNGAIVVEDDNHNGALPGKVLRAAGYQEQAKSGKPIFGYFSRSYSP